MSSNTSRALDSFRLKVLRFFSRLHAIFKSLHTSPARSFFQFEKRSRPRTSTISTWKVLHPLLPSPRRIYCQVSSRNHLPFNHCYTRFYIHGKTIESGSLIAIQRITFLESYLPFANVVNLWKSPSPLSCVSRRGSFPVRSRIESQVSTANLRRTRNSNFAIKFASEDNRE